MNKQYIVNEIQRTAINGKAVGQRRFETETGIKQHEWRGKYWARWGDALAEAGFSQNQWQFAHDESFIFHSLLVFARKLGKLPTKSEIDLERRHNHDLPSSSAITRLGGRVELIKRLLKFCAVHPEYVDVEEILKAIAPKEHPKKLSDKSATAADGYVYLVGAQNAHKIGCTRAPYRRTAEIANQSADGAILEHFIATDDPEGIEKYWHHRFADKRIAGANKQSGEWFRLSKDDVTAFKRRKNFM
jgi:hypothetical protein